MSNKPDDLEAVRTIVSALEPFDDNEKERIIRWATEKLGLKNIPQQPLSSGTVTATQHATPHPHQHSHSGAKDIKTFLQEKSPNSANQLVAAVAYYFKFEAPESQRKSGITKDDVVDACRKAAIERPKFPNQIMVNASAYGLVDNVGTGTYEINAVGENLVAVSMPTAGHGNSKNQNASKGKKKTKKK
jgi:hypothetical protein